MIKLGLPDVVQSMGCQQCTWVDILYGFAEKVHTH